MLSLESEQVDAPMPCKPRFVLVVTVEGLGTNLVGCYGGAIGPTKNLDSFACRSVVFDQFWADTSRPVDVLESMWTGSHFASRGNDPSIKCHSLFERAILITDSVEVLEESTLGDFGSVLLVESHSDAPEEASQTQFTRLFEAALGQWATQRDEYPLLWIHSRGLNGDWDAPHEYRCVMCDEGDPDPPIGTIPGVLAITEETDPDEVFGLACAMGGQAMVFDDAWSLIEEILWKSGLQTTVCRSWRESKATPSVSTAGLDMVQRRFTPKSFICPWWFDPEISWKLESECHLWFSPIPS